MTTHKLMQPRFKVIADYPNSPFRIGDILEIIEDPTDKWICHRTARTYNTTPANYPSIFKLLEWWEERTGYEMPEYVWYNATGFEKEERLIVLHVIEWVKELDGEIWAKVDFICRPPPPSPTTPHSLTN